MMLYYTMVCHSSLLFVELAAFQAKHGISGRKLLLPPQFRKKVTSAVSMLEKEKL